MKKTDASVVMLNDLLKINTDRVERYKKAGYDTIDPELKSVFYAIADESRKNITDISMLLMRLCGSPKPERPVNTGRIYKAWQEVKSKFSGTWRNNLLNSCEFGELAAISAYTMAKIETINAGIGEVLGRQIETLKASMEVIKSYRQAYDKLDKVPR
jgi:uncharacterized protein (TIGR02284 family)